MKPPHAVTTLKICNGACHFEHPAVAPRGQLQPRSGIRQQSGTSLIRRCRLFQFGKRRVGVNRSDRVTCHMPQPLCLDVTRPGDAHATLARCFSPPHFPVEPRELGGGWTFAEIAEGTRALEGFEVLARQIPHKGGRTFGYRVSDGTGSIAYLSDHSPTSLGPGPDGLGERHESALALADGVDLLITDAQHLAAQFPDVAFLGHASVEYDVELAVEAGVRTLVLFHHDPWRTDDEVDALLGLARERAAGRVEVIAAREGLEVGLGG